MHGRAASGALVALFLCTSWTGILHAHSLLDTPTPRDQQDGYKDGSACGVTRASSQPVTNYKPGQQLTVEWLETVDHSGCFLVEFSAQGDQNFQILGRKSHNNPPPPANPSSNDPRPWSLSVTLPNTSCDGCTLRLRQFMLDDNVTEDACPPATVPNGSTYTTCANVTLSDGAPSGGAGGTAAGGTAAGGTAAGGTAAGGTAAGGASGGNTAGGNTTGGASGGTAASGTAAGGASGGNTAAGGPGASGAGAAGAPVSSSSSGEDGGCNISTTPGSKPSILGSLVVLGALLRRRLVRRR